MLEVLFSFLFVGTNWSSLLYPFENMSNELISEPMLIGAIIFLFFLMFALVLYLPFSAVVVVMMPTLYVVFEYIEPLRIVVGILVGLLVGLGLLKWVKR